MPAKAAGRRRQGVTGSPGGKASKQAKAGSKKRDEDASTEMGDGLGDLAARALVKSPDQLELTEAEGGYKLVDYMDQTAIHFSLNGNMVPKDSDEGRRQSIRSNIETEKAPVETSVETSEEAETKDKEHTGDTEAAGEGEGEGEATVEASKAAEAAEAEEPPAPKVPEKKIPNQFNFIERASMTPINPLRERGCQSEPIPSKNFSANVNQWDIYDVYVEELQKMEKAKEKEKSKPQTIKIEEEKRGGRKLSHVEPLHIEPITRVARAAKIAERMVTLNAFDDIAQDFKYFEDASDEFRGQQGTLLPLWNFQYEKTKKLAVTAISWNPKYKDLFAVGYGSYLLQQVCVFLGLRTQETIITQYKTGWKVGNVVVTRAEEMIVMTVVRPRFSKEFEERSF
ncbi:dynein intermediate chain 1, axonemal [Willisornis vidua]|uniref:Dynein intermediate chain 1, axonemal n=1 Tax=Willisornis vidua TaxID=1566151 RepID=A0ABQ9DS42_9PASS|nr:dynein intermediate chain 1, axonemal [Willisornis vidua]